MIADFLPCAILVPSLNRPQNLERVVANIHEATPEDHFILFAVSDSESMRILDELGEWYLDDSDQDDHRYVTRMNKLVRKAVSYGAQTMFFGSDDVIHHYGWLTRALSVMEKEGVSLVVVNDLHNSIGTQAIIRRQYLRKAVFDAPGKAFHPGYLHNFADNEQFYTAARRGEYARALDSVVEHLHPTFGGPKAAPWDETYVNAQRGWDQDIEVWRERAELINRAIPNDAPAFSVR